MAQQTYTQTIVGVFESYDAAHQAAHELMAAGIPESSIDIDSEQKTTAAHSHPVSAEAEESGFSGWLHRLFGSEEESDGEHVHYGEAVKRGQSVLTATVDESQVASASAILNQHGSADIDSHVEKWKATGYEAPVSKTYDATTASAPIPVIEEELAVGKRTVQNGGVRVYSRVVEEPVEEQVNLREEHVTVERRPVDRAVTTADMSGLRDSTIEVTQMAEEAVVSKRARVVEEVVVDKVASERTETIKDSLKRTEVEVEDTRK